LLEGWSFSKKKWKFTTPESRQMNDNLKLDPNKMMVRIAQKQIRIKDNSKSSMTKKSAQDGKSKLHSLTIPKETVEKTPIQTHNDEDDNTASSKLNRAFCANELKLIHKTMDPDLDSIDNNSKKDSPQPNNIIINDLDSTASSITINTTERRQPPIPNQLLASQEDTASSISTVSLLESITSSIHSITRWMHGARVRSGAEQVCGRHW
jgi:hypothetical protein